MRRRAVALGLAATALLAGCAVVRQYRQYVPPAKVAPGPVFDEAGFARKPLATFVLRTPGGVVPAETVIGKRGTYRIRQGDTLLDVARWYDLGYNEIVAANPGVDPWVPPVGTTVVIPTEWILPCCTYEGLVLNIPEFRLFYYERSPTDPRALVVRTFPVGLGREDRRTPRGRFRVRGKTVNPRWNIPQSIRAEHIRERGDARTSIAGGDPDNPLGKYRIELTIPFYTIHGTNIPWGAGMAVSHGCTRLYPEDIEALFPRVTVGMAVEFVYQPAKAGRRGDGIFVETHPDIYRFRPSLYGEALATLRRQGLDARVDPVRVGAAVKDARGLPLRVN